MLKWRVLTGMALGPAVLCIVWLLPPVLAAVVFAGVVLIGAGEWARLVSVPPSWRLPFMAAVVGLVLAAGFLLTQGVASTAIVVTAGIIWLIPIYQLATYVGGAAAVWPRWLAASVALFAVAASWVGVVAPLLTMRDGSYALTALLIMVWGSDIGAYFAGRRFGRRPLARAISPAKTWEGCLGGLVVGVLATGSLIGAAGWLGLFEGDAPWHHLALAPLVTAAAVAGDLFESLLKRQAGAKDSGRLIAGHGGVFDRIDGLMMAAPLYAVLVIGSG